MSTPSLDEQRDYWKYWQRTRTDSKYAEERAREVLNLLPTLSLEQPRILDLGCGTGWFTEQLARFGSATGLDLNDEAMAEANLRWPHIRFIGGDVFSHQLAVASFDLVVSLQVIAHVEDQVGFMRRIADLLRPGGYLILSTNNPVVMSRLGSSDGVDHAAMGHIEKWLSTQQLRKIVSRYLEVLKVWTISPTGNGGLLRVVNSPKLNSVLELAFTAQALRRMKERLGFGYTTLLLARHGR